LTGLDNMRLSKESTERHGILIADADNMVCDYLASFMEEEGVAVRVARDGVEAVLAFIYEADQLDAALIDISLPELNGLNVLRILKAIDPGFPVAMLSGRIDGDGKIESTALAHGARVVVPKPFQGKMLRELISEMMSR